MDIPKIIAIILFFSVITAFVILRLCFKSTTLVGKIVRFLWILFSATILTITIIHKAKHGQ